LKTDIYLINGSTFSDSSEFCLRLCKKAYRAGHEIHIRTYAAHESEVLDRVLWEHDKESFLPHKVLSSGHHTTVENQPQTPITISHESLSSVQPLHRDLVILLSPKIETEIKQFKRTALIVPNDHEKLELARAVYRQFKTSEIDVNIHDLRR
jgi:DNA polymerase IIIc chi subunit